MLTFSCTCTATHSLTHSLTQLCEPGMRYRTCGWPWVGLCVSRASEVACICANPAPALMDRQRYSPMCNALEHVVSPRREVNCVSASIWSGRCSRSIGPATGPKSRHTTAGHSGCICCRRHVCRCDRARNSTRGCARGLVLIALREHLQQG